MARINSRQQLKEYALRALGAPVLLINVDDEQLEDRIDDALDLFYEYHADGSELVFISHQLTQQDLDQRYITLPDGILSVISVFAPGSNTGGSGSNGIATMDNLQYQMYITDIMNYRRILAGDGISSWYISMSYMNLMNDTFSSEDRRNFNKHNDKLILQGDWGMLKAGDFVTLEAYRRLNMPEVGEAYNNYWLKQYVTAVFKRQWGSNLIKFAGATLPGGMTVNAEQIHNDAKEEVKELEDRLKNEFQEPVDFYMG